MKLDVKFIVASTILTCLVVVNCSHDRRQLTVACPDGRSWCETGSVCTPDSKQCVSHVQLCPDPSRWCTGNLTCTPDSQRCVAAVAYCVDKVHWCEGGEVCTADSKNCQRFRSDDDDLLWLVPLVTQ